MDVVNWLKEYWVIIAGLVTLIITFIKLFSKVSVMEKLIIPSGELQAKLEVEVKKQLSNHCPYQRDINELQDWRKIHTEWGLRTQGETHDSLQEIKINLKMVCNSLGVDYQSGNGK